MSSARLDKYLPVVLHGLAWMTYGVSVYTGNAARYTFFQFCLYYGIIITVHASVFYANFLYLIPTILGRLRFPVFVGYNSLLIIALSLVTVVILENATGLPTDGPKITQATFPVNVLIRMINNGLFLVLALIIRFSVDWYQQKRNEKELENGRLKTELAFLKAQINPHFLFNALNNVYALSLKQSPETPDVILKISQLMRYLLYETSDQKVSLHQEIEMIRTYIAIMQLRNQNKADLTLTILGDYQTVLIEPLLLLPIIENIFKHGTYPIVISLHADKIGFSLETQNRIKLHTNNEKAGIGLKNLSRRLELLYPEQHAFSVAKEGNLFRSTLSLKF